LLKFILENVDLSEFFRSGRVQLACTQRDLITKVRAKTYRQFQLDILTLRASAFLMAEEIPGLMKRFKEAEMDRILDLKTGQHFHEQWVRQVLENYPYFAQYEGMDSLVGRFAGKPALVISRGPSLDRSIEAVKALADSTVLVAVGGAIRRLWEAGVTPDFALFLDANGMQEQLNGIPQSVLDNITFLMSPFNQHCTYTTPSRGKMVFLAQSSSNYSDWMDKVLETRHYRVPGGGTVSLLALQTAMAMQCSPIILVGQDLAFPNNQVYAGNISLITNKQGQMDLPRSETLYTAPQKLTTTPGQREGEMLPTLGSFKSYIRHFEELAEKNAKSANPLELYNTSLGGAKIEGYTLRDLAEFVPLLEPWKQGGPALPEPPVVPAARVEVRRKKLLKGLRKLRTALKECSTLCAESQRKLEYSLEESAQSMDLLQHEYRKLNNFWRRHEFVGYIGLYEHIRFRQQLNQLNDPKERAIGGCQALATMLGNCQTLFLEKVISWIDQAEAALLAQESSVEESSSCAVLPAVIAPAKDAKPVA
jgi:hypothetical protein